jgi:beta-galactosidase
MKLSRLPKPVLPILIGWLLTAAAANTFAQVSPRERISIDPDWRFAKGDPAGTEGRLAYSAIKQWTMASGESLVVTPDAPHHARPAGNIGGDVSYTRPDFSDGSWRQLDLPHDWGIEGPFNPQASGSTAMLPFAGIGWYRKHLEIPAADQGKQVYLDMDGAMSYASVWCNGQYAGGWGYGYSSFRVDLTPYIKYGGENVLAIRVENPPASSRWYPGGGIYRNVWLVKTSPVHVGEWGTYVTTPSVTADSASVILRTSVENDSKASAGLSVRMAIYPIDINDRRTGPAVATTAPTALSVDAGQTRTISLDTSIARPALWSTKAPNRYVAAVTVEQDGKVVDTYDTPFGVRSLAYDPNKGLLLNGQPTRIQGVCDHADLGALGTVANVRGLQRQLEMLQAMGGNAIRTSHNPPAPELLDLADKMGFLVMDEMFDSWSRQKTPNDYHLLFGDWSEKDARMLLRRDRNHPSVIFWSIGNEIGEADSAQGQATARRLTDICHEEDPTRAVTSARNSYNSGFNGYQNIMDAFGFNYLRAAANNFQMFAAFHEANPQKMVFSSESCSTISSRGVYAFPANLDVKGGGGTADGQMSSYDLFAPPWASPPDWEWKAEDICGVVAGEFVWTGFDYLGEPTRNGAGGGGRGGRGGGGANPARSSYFGIIDLAGFPKDRFYLYQSRWRPDLPMAHILPHWNWPDRVGQVTPVHVYTSGDSGELFLNGRSLGKKTKGQYEYRLRWDDVKYEPGELKVVTYKDGKEWATESVRTTGPAEKLLLTPDRATIAGDGSDLSFVTLTVADKDGRMVPATHNTIQFEISGPGEIVATDNGDPTDLNIFSSPQRKAFNGLALAIVRAKRGQSGQIVLTAKSEGLTTATATLTAK